jgi:hypothetical protein
MKCQNVADPVGQQDDLSVVLYRPIREASRWLLKIHGCVSEPDGIVLSLQDYDKFEASRLPTLCGLVQANLMTSHFFLLNYVD